MVAFYPCYRTNVEFSDADAHHRDCLREVYQWVTTYLTQSHEKLGRRGAVCPQTLPALELNQILLGVVEGSTFDDDAFAKLVSEAVQVFRGLKPSANPSACVILCFPDYDTLEGHLEIDRTHKRLKPEIVEQGLMLGQFFGSCSEPGLHSREFRPFQSPVPLLAVRAMVEGDLAFLQRTPHLLPHYYRRFPSSRPAAHPAIAAALTHGAVTHKVHRHTDCSEPIKSPADFARCIGVPIEHITKTVLLVSQRGPLCLAVCSAHRKMKFEVLSEAFKNGRLQVAPLEQLEKVLDYPRNSVSPLGAPLDVFIDGDLTALPTVLIGGGVVGIEIELAPNDLVRTANATVLSFAV